MRSILQVARRYRTGVRIAELTTLLPEDGPTGASELSRWLEERPGLAQIDGDRVLPDGVRPIALAERAARGHRYRSAAIELVDRHLAPVLPWVQCVGITGSTAYGEPEEGDDLDFFVVTRPGSLWLFLTYTYLAVRFRFRPDGSESRPLPCFNYVLDAPTAVGEFTRPRGFLFAREALTARVLHGEDYYGALLAAAPWLGEEIPRLYSQRRAASPPAPAAPAPLGIQLVNAALFLPVATYLHLAGLRRNAGFRRERAESDVFQTRTGFRRLTFASSQFERLREDLDGFRDPTAWFVHPGSGAPGTLRASEFLDSVPRADGPTPQRHVPDVPSGTGGRSREYGATSSMPMATDPIPSSMDPSSEPGGR